MGNLDAWEVREVAVRLRKRKVAQGNGWGIYINVCEEVLVDLMKWPVQRAQNLLEVSSEMKPESPALAPVLVIGCWKSSKISPLRRKHSSWRILDRNGRTLTPTGWLFSVY